MSDENLNTEVVPTAELPEVAPVEPVAQDVQPQEAESAADKPKTFTQEELDDILQKRIARERRKLEREMQQHQPQQAQPKLLSRDQFASDDEYIDAVTDAKIAHKEAARRHSEVLAKFSEKEEEAIEKYGDYDQVVRNNNSLPITDAMADVIRESDIGPDIAYYLGTNVKEAARISKLSIIQQAKEIGKIEARLDGALDGASAPQKKVSNAPAPINPVVPKTGTPTYDLDDPRSYQQLGADEWRKRRKEQQIREYEAKRR